MKVSFEASFARDLKGIKDKTLLKRVEHVIAEVKTATALSEIKHLRKMRGHATLYRLRLGDYRIGIEVVEDEVIFVRILQRKDIYRYFPQRGSSNLRCPHLVHDPENEQRSRRG